MHCARGTSGPAFADVQSLGYICTARAGHGALRARMLIVYVLYARARGACAPACADVHRLGLMCTARAGHVSLRARIPNA